MSFKKLVGRSALVCSGTAIAISALPGIALAKGNGWGPNDIMSNITDNTMKFNNTFDFSTIATWVQTVTTTVLGIAIFLFLLRIALTAFDRLLTKGGSGDGNNRGGTKGEGGGMFTGIPVVGAYTSDVSWMDIWKIFGKNVAIVLGAWIIVQVIVSIAMFIFDSLGVATAAKNS